MEILKFTLTGKTAFFKKPDVNTVAFYSYSNIHKPALLGIIGATLGYSGYSTDFVEYPEYYKKLKDLKIGIVPNNIGSFDRLIQTYTNTTGFFNKNEAGGGATLIVKEQWLVNPSWDIYIDLNHELGDKIKEYITEEKSVFTIYLGNNTHFANIEDIEVLNGEATTNYNRIDSIFTEDVASPTPKKTQITFNNFNNIKLFKTKEFLPVTLIQDTCNYIQDKFVHTTEEVTPIKEVVKIKDKYIYLF